MCAFEAAWKYTYGEKTIVAIANFLRDLGESGVIDVDTWQKLEEILDEVEDHRLSRWYNSPQRVEARKSLFGRGKLVFRTLFNITKAHYKGKAKRFALWIGRWFTKQKKK